MRSRLFALLVIVFGTACGDGEIGDDPAAGGTGGAGGAAAAAGSGAAAGSAGTGGIPPEPVEDVDELVADQSLAIPQPGTFELRLLSPRWVEVRAITTKDPDPAPLDSWNIVSGSSLSAPAASSFAVTADGSAQPVSRVGFRRRVLYAPLAPRDLRIDNRLLLELESPLADGALVRVSDGSGSLWPASVVLEAAFDPLRPGPAIHVNQTGYARTLPKQARVGYWLGSLGELPAPVEPEFFLIRTKDGSVAHQGTLTPDPEHPDGFLGSPYQQVMAADFSSFDTPGNYRLRVPGLGASTPFFIGDGAVAAFARTYALGLYHQRCGVGNDLPFTRFVRKACHTAPAQIPTTAAEFSTTNALIADTTKDFTNQTAPTVTSVDTSLYPFQKSGTIDVSGGHHDAGDYSKYTTNSAYLIHSLVFAVDNFPGVAELDNLGVPESGDGKSDLLSAAKWEAEFLAKLQDSDGGFFTLVYPKHRRYEHDVLPENGDPQVVWPKTTAVTAAAVAALAEIGSSPRFRSEHGAAAGDAFIAKAELGWQFLEQAIAKHGKDGAFQVVYHYGQVFRHDDELAWAAAALFAATGQQKYAGALASFFPDPSAPSSFQWGWWRLFEGYGCAVRSYAFAARSGRRAASELDSAYLAKCEEQVRLCGDDQRRWADMDAYGTSFPDISKHYFGTGWYFSSHQAFDATVAHQLDPKPELIETIVSNMNFEGGTNPANVSYLTGLGWHRQREIVSQQARNDWQLLPPSGIVIGSTQAGFMWLDLYGSELGALSFPGDETPIYDRWADSFNVTTESVSVNLARSLASLAFLLTLTPAKDVAWKAAPATIVGLDTPPAVGEKRTLSLDVPGQELAGARLVWETSGGEPSFGRSFELVADSSGAGWVEVEAQWPDGRRAFARKDFAVP
jgi:hypothetical protein